MSICSFENSVFVQEKKKEKEKQAFDERINSSF